MYMIKIITRFIKIFAIAIMFYCISINHTVFAQNTVTIGTEQELRSAVSDSDNTVININSSEITLTSPLA